MNVVLANIIIANENELVVSLNKGYYLNTYNPFRVRSEILSEILKWMESKNYISIKKGYFFDDNKKRTRIHIKNLMRTSIEPTTEIISKNDNNIIKIKNVNKEYINKKFTDYATKAEKKLNLINEVYSRHKIEYNGIAIPVSMYRVFNNGLFNSGGRFYGGFFQNMKSKCRSKLIINGNNVVEIDYTELHISMMYAKLKVVPGLNLYTVKGFSRKITKLAVNVMLNSKSKKTAKKAITTILTKHYGSKKNADKLIESILDTHSLIRYSFFNPKIGGKLQNQESKLCENILFYFALRNVPVYSIHDSFLIEKKYEKKLKEKMKLFFFRKFRTEILLN